MEPTRSSFLAAWEVVPGAIDYRLDVSPTSSFSSYVVGYEHLDVGNVGSRIVSELSPGTTYYYRVRACNANGVGSNSDIMTAAATTGAGLVIIPTFDSSILGNPNSGAIQSAINQAVAIFQALFHDPITVRILFRYSNTYPNGSPFPSNIIGSASPDDSSVPWNTYINALTADARTANDAIANASLPPGPLTPNMIFTTANGRSLGFNTPGTMDATGNSGAGTFDGIVTLNSNFSFSFVRPPSSNSIDAIRLSQAGIDLVLGSLSHLDSDGSDLGPQDLFSWAAPGNRNVTSDGVRYLSINGGNNKIVNFNQTAGAGFSFWQFTSCPQTIPYVYNAVYCPGQFSDVTSTSPEGVNLDVIGYDLNSVNPTPTPCGTTLSENFDAVLAPALPAGWVATNASGNSTKWVTSLISTDTSPNVAFIPDQSGISDKYLDTPSISIISASAQVRFRNYFDTEFTNGTYWDGGVLEVSSPNINGGVFTDILAAGGNFAAGGYTGVISNAAGNPLAGRMAWSGNSGAYINTVVNLGPNVTGHTIKLRFRMGTDQAVAAQGWRVDTVVVIGGVCPSTTLANISTRLRVETGDNVLIGGFIVVTGTQPKRVIVRAIGPSLPLPGGLPDPVLELRNSAGELIWMNDDWRTNQEAEIIATGLSPNNNLESAIVATLPANNSAYTAIVRDHNNVTGVGLVEAYDLDNTVNSKLGNISTRGFVGTGDNVMIGGFIVGGQISTRVIVRALGPSVPLANKLADPSLALHDGNGALIVSNDNWRSGGQGAEIIGTGLQPANDLESAIVRTLTPGNYTAIVRGVSDTTGVALVEVYDLGPP
jgi:hypothetical protein